MKEDLIDLFKFKPMNFEFFLNQINIGDVSKKQIRNILAETKRIPAALGPYHGTYEGGLYDHILLVTNFVFQIRENADILNIYVDRLREEHVNLSENYNEIDLPKALQTAIYHDFGKVSKYGFKLNLQSRKIYTNKVQRQAVSLEINEKLLNSI